MSKKNENQESFRPITWTDHRTLANLQAEKKQTAVDDALQFPGADRFEADLDAMLKGDAESNGEVIVIALLDLDAFDHINKDFGREEGDRVIIAAGQYIQQSLPAEAAIYHIGGYEFGLIFLVTAEREEIFLFLNDLKNGYAVTTPDGVRQTLTIGVATAFEDATRCAELIRKADGALYRAKVGGRNRIAMAKEEKMVPKTSHYTQDQLQRLAKLAKREGVGEAILLREALDMLLKKYDI